MLLDGDDLPALMHRVRAEMGPDAVVVKAERVRTGGVAGFFAKEHFEVTVEVPDRRPGPRVPRPASPGPVGMSALLDAADAADGGDGATAGRAAPAGGSTGTAGPRVSTDGDGFARLLASIDDMADVHPAPPARPAPPAPAQAGSASATVPDAASSARADAPPPPPSDDDAPPRPQHPAARFAPRGATVTAATFGPLTALDAHPAPAPAGPADSTADSPPDPAPEATPVADDPTGAPTGGDRRALLALGVPASVLGPGPSDEPMPLSRLLAGLPRPPAPERTPGAVVVVVGEGTAALPVAVQLAQRAHLEPGDVALAGAMPPVAGHRRRLPNPTAAARHRDKVADGEQVGVVAVGVGPEPEDRAAAAQLIAALAPEQCWAVVDARRKTTDLRAWMRDVAGTRPIDALAATWVHATQDPGTVLDLGAPVGWLDGLPATPVVWAAVLSERLDAGARWD
ncbi:hypothetical protein [Cellulomonas sp. ATA003]|uniref:hypothetical protein n=1 Tax=Cellulomonas sp. ATA003 TaxID=3073064 RepID=UPI002873E3C9|nr:hypothetical protein [Cellulomonas sp. ATA003]WNB85226.1 hypothetical protein REH70_16560 [Cellulomonas sp. ATA003]